MNLVQAAPSVAPQAGPAAELFVSVIIPTHRAADTVAQTLDSLLAQSHQGWEAIIIDDGSDDDTTGRVESYAAKDERIRLLRQAHAGVSAARNRGIDAAAHDWLLFLDADDIILPHHLERLLELVQAQDDCDVACSGWTRITPQGRRIDHNVLPPNVSPDTLLRGWPAIHACLVRRALVQEVGGFDPSLRTCEDGDLWLRLAAAGARFRAIPEPSALYVVRPGTATSDFERLLSDGFDVLERASNNGLVGAGDAARWRLADEQAYFLCWCAGLQLGASRDARPMLGMLVDEQYPSLDPALVARRIFQGIPLSQARPYDVWAELWPARQTLITAFLDALEERSRCSDLARSVTVLLEQLIAEQLQDHCPMAIGTTHIVRLELTESLQNRTPAPEIQRLFVHVTLEGERLGTVALPVCDGFVSRHVLADAIADEQAWPLLDRFLQATVYDELQTSHDGAETIVTRRGQRLAQLPAGATGLSPHIHQQAGWTLFLQELWRRPRWPQDHFYDASAAPDEDGAACNAEAGWLVVEVSRPLPTVHSAHDELRLLVTVGGVAVGVVTVSCEDGRVTAQAIRAAITRSAGMELCRAALREGVVGRPLAAGGTLQERLARAAAARAAADNGGRDLLLAPQTSALLHDEALAGATFFGRRSDRAIDSAASRRASLPTEALEDLLQAAYQRGEPLLQHRGAGQHADRALYAPDLCWLPAHGRPPAVELPEAPDTAQTPWFYDRSYFEGLFATRPDPWQYNTEYERIKYRQTLSLLPRRRIGRALEVGCAEGHFTLLLAPYVEQLVAADISRIALDRARARCADSPNVQFRSLDLLNDELPGLFNLIVCSELLYFMRTPEALAQAARKLAQALNLGGHLLLAHANLVVDEPQRTGFDWDFPFGAATISDTFQRCPSLLLEKEIDTPLYRIQLFRRVPRFLPTYLRSPAQVTKVNHPPALPHPRVAATIRWGGEATARDVWPAGDVVTQALPILMYHRVTPAAPGRLARYCISPAQFEEQLRYLRDAGYYSIDLEQWQAAMARHEPLPGRALMLTFDDGYRDFLQHAWPLLEKYGFSATVFLVAGHVGGQSAWDQQSGESAPLLTWGQIRRLQAQGIRFGAHTHSHRRLTALSPAQMARELARSRARLERELERPVDALAYPYGAQDAVVRHLAGACGFTFGLTCRMGKSSLWDSPLALPRIEISGHDSFADFALKVETGGDRPGGE